MAERDRIVGLELGFGPEAAVSGAVLVQTEYAAWLTFNGVRPTSRISPYGEPYRESAGTAVLRFRHCSITKFDYPNDEAQCGIPRYKDLAYGLYEVLHSSWKDELLELNRYSFPDSKPTDARHFLITFHDSTFECLAAGFEHELVEGPYEETFKRISEHVLGE